MLSAIDILNLDILGRYCLMLMISTVLNSSLWNTRREHKSHKPFFLLVNIATTSQAVIMLPQGTMQEQKLIQMQQANEESSFFKQLIESRIKPFSCLKFDNSHYQMHCFLLGTIQKMQSKKLHPLLVLTGWQERKKVWAFALQARKGTDLLNLYVNIQNLGKICGTSLVGGFKK